jgi:hypothetical protein
VSVQHSNGRFWLCPGCRRHVPVRKDACVCGFDRTTAQAHEVAARPPRPKPQRSAFATLWLFAAAAVLVGWIAHGRVQGRPAADAPGNASPAVAVSPVAAPNPGSGEVLEATVDGTPAVAPQRPGLPAATPQAPILSTEVARQATAAAPHAAVEVDDERRARDEEAGRRQQEIEWRTRTTALIARLRAAHAGYRSQVCAEARGGIAVSTTRDNTGAYVSARAEAQALQESARLAGVPAGWVRISWSEFPEPEDAASGGYNPAAVAQRWSCGNVTGWGH